MTSQNTNKRVKILCQRYYTTKRLRRDLLSSTPNCYICLGEFRRHLCTARKIQLTDWSTAGQQGILVFVVSTKPSLAQFISLFTTGKISSFDRPNYRSIQVFHLKTSVETKRRKEIRFDKQFL